MTPSNCLVNVARVFGVTINDLLSNKRQQHITVARQAAYYILRQHSFMSFAAIGAVFTRDHSTVMHGIGVATERMAQDPRYAALVEEAMS